MNAIVTLNHFKKQLSCHHACNWLSCFAINVKDLIMIITYECIFLSSSAIFQIDRGYRLCYNKHWNKTIFKKEPFVIFLWKIILLFLGQQLIVQYMANYETAVTISDHLIAMLKLLFLRFYFNVLLMITSLKTNIGTEKIISEAEERTLLLLLLQLLK